MKRAELRRFGPLFVAAAILLYRELVANKGVLGTRTMSAIEDFKKRLGPVALQVERQKGLKAALGLGQGAHESGWGASALSSPTAKLEVLNNAGHVLRIGPAHNHFGITAELGTYWRTQDRPYVIKLTEEWVTQAQIRPTDVVVAGPNANGLFKIKRKRPFRAYNSPEESYLDWARLMETKPYVDAGATAALRAGDVAGFAAAMKRVGYATDPNYAELIAGSIQSMGAIA
jgi:peptidoglycan hydrolase FlgJ